MHTLNILLVIVANDVNTQLCAMMLYYFGEEMFEKVYLFIVLKKWSLIVRVTIFNVL
jgi:hypothetical protein